MSKIATPDLSKSQKKGLVKHSNSINVCTIHRSIPSPFQTLPVGDVHKTKKNKKGDMRKFGSIIHVNKNLVLENVDTFHRRRGKGEGGDVQLYF